MNPTADRPLADPAKLRPRRVVLVVDDSDIIRLLVQRMLASEPYDLILTKCGSDGLQAARMQQPDLIVLDNMLGDMDAEAFCAALAQADPPLEFPVLLITAYQKAGANFPKPGKAWYQPKPFDTAKLRAKLRTIFAELAALTPPAAIPEPEATGGSFRLVPTSAIEPVQPEALAVGEAQSPFGWPREGGPVGEATPSNEELTALPTDGISLRHRILLEGSPEATQLRLFIDGQLAAAVDYSMLRAVVRVHETGIKLLCRPALTIYLQSALGRNALVEQVTKRRVDWLAGSAMEIRVEGLVAVAA